MAPVLAVAVAFGGLGACRRGDGPRVARGAGDRPPASAMGAPGAPGSAGAATAAPAPDPDPPPRGTHISLLYAANLRGEYEPCG